MKPLKQGKNLNQLVNANCKHNHQRKTLFCISLPASLMQLMYGSNRLVVHVFLLGVM
jgi:hypothetical protein